MLTKDMIEDGWVSICEMWFCWVHQPTLQVVNLRRKENRSCFLDGWHMAPGEEEAEEVWALSRYTADEYGEPLDDDEFDGFLTASEEKAIAMARAMRQKITEGVETTFAKLLSENEST